MDFCNMEGENWWKKKKCRKQINFSDFLKKEKNKYILLLVEKIGLLIVIFEYYWMAEC